jgi:hypothetical protein
VNRDFEDLGGRDPYEMLGVRPGADLEEINRRHRRLLRKTHPDVGGDHDQQARLNLARDILRDPRRRREYEERLRGPDVEEVPEQDETPAYEDPYDWVDGADPPTVFQDPPEYVDYPPPVYTYHRAYDQRPTYVYYPPPMVVPRRRWNTSAIVAISLSFCFPVAWSWGSSRSPRSTGPGNEALSWPGCPW